MKKKILSLMLAVVMMLSLSVTALAASVQTGVSADGTGTVTLTKSYTISGTAPTETFYLVQVGDVDISEDSSATVSASLNLDTDTTASIQVESNEIVVSSVEIQSAVSTTTGTFTIGLPEYTKVGTYTYTLKEYVGSTAGVTYSSDTYYLIVYVMNVLDDDNLPTGGLTVTTDIRKSSVGGTKTDVIENEYKSGSLKITKTVTGAYGDTSSDNVFYFRVEFNTPNGKTWNGQNVMINGETVSLTAADNGQDYDYYYDFSLYSGQYITITNLPENVGYTVVELTGNGGTEVAAGGSVGSYEVTYDTSVSGTITSNATSDTTVTNEYDGEPDTGISLDSLPYILMLIVVAAGVVVMISRRRLDNRF
ncbi:MAG: hypothetical protein LUI10_08590 [Lachnospiraceae bacterium]|nr:hypothetical protein [Lachnospiraceae bacterium]